MHDRVVFAKQSYSAVLGKLKIRTKSRHLSVDKVCPFTSYLCGLWSVSKLDNDDSDDNEVGI